MKRWPAFIWVTAIFSGVLMNQWAGRVPASELPKAPCQIKEPCPRLLPSHFLLQDRCAFSPQAQAMAYTVPLVDKGPYTLSRLPSIPHDVLNYHEFVAYFFSLRRGPDRRVATSLDKRPTILLGHNSQSVSTGDETTEVCQWP